MNRIFIVVLALLSIEAFSQTSNKIITSDIDNFWIAFDSIQKTGDYSRKLNLINELYIDKGTEGLKAFMKLRDYNDSLYVELIEKHPRFWSSIRPNTLSVKSKMMEFDYSLSKLRDLYPELKDGVMYFTIGGLRSGGTVSGNMALVGAEIATGNQNTDVSEFKDDWLKNVFAEQSLDNIVSVNIHEYIHTQQKPYNVYNVLKLTLREGACEFITELAIEKTLQRKFITYGEAHLPELKEKYKREMFTNNILNWLYNGSQKGESADMGYYMGYKICKAYYNQAEDKVQAIKDIIELDYNDDKAIEGFLEQSKFFDEKIDKVKLIEEYNNNLPYITGTAPFTNGSKDVNPHAKELRITFSKEMEHGNYSIRQLKKGKGQHPVKKIIGFENSDKTLVLGIDLQPGIEYEFLITRDSFTSKEGHPLKDKEFLVKFKTK